MSVKVSEETYKKAKGYKPDNLDDTEYLGKVAKVMNVREKNIALIWVSDSYEDYLNMKSSDYSKRKTEIELLKSKAEDKMFDEALLRIGDSMVGLGNGLKQLIYARRKVE